MTRFRPTLVAAALAFVCVPVSAAEAKVTDVDGVVAILSGMGHAIVETVDDDGTNLVVDGGKWSLSMFDCTGRTACQEAFLYARRDPGHPVIDSCSNDFNEVQSRGAAWLDNLNRPWYKATINLEGDPGVASVTSSINWYKTLLAKFEAHVADCPPIRKDL